MKNIYILLFLILTSLLNAEEANKLPLFQKALPTEKFDLKEGNEFVTNYHFYTNENVANIKLHLRKFLGPKWKMNEVKKVELDQLRKQHALLNKNTVLEGMVILSHHDFEDYTIGVCYAKLSKEEWAKVFSTHRLSICVVKLEEPAEVLPLKEK